MKASAGSGKTYNLAKTYLEILVKSQDPYAYRHILAVTFTNKATDEMKDRILRELYVLAKNPEASPYYIGLLNSVSGASLESMKRKCGAILNNILHDYSSFSVSTIDKFFQRTLKAFSREIGQFASYQVELDKMSLVQESVDRILDSLQEGDDHLLKWLTDSALDVLETEGKNNLESGLYAMAESLKSEEYASQAERFKVNPEKDYSFEKLMKLKSGCKKVMNGFEDAVQKSASEVKAVFEKAGVSLSDTSSHFLSKIEDYVSVKSGGEIAKPTDAFLRSASNEDAWFSKQNAKTYLPLLSGVLNEPLDAFVALFGTPFKTWRTARIIDRQIYNLGIAGDLSREFNALMKEKNVLSIDDSNHILRNIIDGNDAPFIYEKIGVRYLNYLLDEFQDTSLIQWENFNPLLRESDSQNCDDLIVGDVKQSIYRWRGSDWNLLNVRLKQEFNDARETTLDSNFRSLRNIVSFNNEFFKVAAKAIDSFLGDGTSDVVSQIYSDVCQQVKTDDEAGGLVSLEFCEPDEEAVRILSAIQSVVDSGGKYGDIAILVRINDIGSSVASLLLENGIPVISDDSLNIKSSLIVRRLVALLSLFNNPKGSLSAYMAGMPVVKVPSGARSLTDLCESVLRDLQIDDPEHFSGEISYIQSFMDNLQTWSGTYGNSLADFLDYWSRDDVTPKLSSAEDENSVRVMTIHKSKGLAFPYVIIPYAEKTVFNKSGNIHWCHPAVKGTELENIADGIYSVKYTKGTADSFFSDDYLKDTEMQAIDGLNTFYVAATRARKGMTVISKWPSGKTKNFVKSGAKIGEDRYSFSDISEVLYYFAIKGSIAFSSPHSEEESEEEKNALQGTFRLGGQYDFARCHEHDEQASVSEVIKSGYESYPLNPVVSVSDGEGGSEEKIVERLAFSNDASDFFSEDGKTGTEASARLKGIVMHDILSEVRVPGDLDEAVDNAFLDGLIDEGETREIKDLLRERIGEVASRGWFPNDSSKILNETALIDTDGKEYRPDRVVISDGKVTVIDYKFGDKDERYSRQIRRYADIYRRMGYENVVSALWYVRSGEIVFNTDLF
ncbi:MAG: UvrD-helicase domain-containing protein [Bacteroidales bacterium]